MDVEKLKEIWQAEERAAHVCGWDFSHIRGRCEEQALPWDYAAIVRRYLTANTRLLDHDTGGGEFLLSLRHPGSLTSATEGYAPNIALCRQRLSPGGVCFKACSDASHIPFEDAAFDLIIDRHGSFHAPEMYRLLQDGGVFITEQVGSENDRDLVEMVLPGIEKPYPHMHLKAQRQVFENAGFRLLQAAEAFRPITFYDVGAFVWFARVIEWEFAGFSVERCFEKLLAMHRLIAEQGRITGTIHRYLIVAQK